MAHIELFFEILNFKRDESMFTVKNLGRNSYGTMRIEMIPHHYEFIPKVLSFLKNSTKSQDFPLFF